MDIEKIRAIFGTQPPRNAAMTTLEEEATELVQMLMMLCNVPYHRMTPENKECYMLRIFEGIERKLTSFCDGLKSSVSRSADDTDPQDIECHKLWFYRTNYLLLDLCILCRAAGRYFVDHNVRSGIVDSTFLERKCYHVQLLTQNLLAEIKAAAELHLKSLSQEATANQLVQLCMAGRSEEQDALGKTFEPIIGRERMEEWAAEVAWSWRETTLGVLKTIESLRRASCSSTAT